LSSKIEIVVEKSELKMLQLNLILWTVIALTLTITINFPEMGDITSKNIDGLQMITEIIIPYQIITVMISTAIAVPIAYSVSRFYKKHLMRFVKEVDSRNKP